MGSLERFSPPSRSMVRAANKVRDEVTVARMHEAAEASVVQTRIANGAKLVDGTLMHMAALHGTGQALCHSEAMARDTLMLISMFTLNASRLTGEYMNR